MKNFWFILITVLVRDEEHIRYSWIREEEVAILRIVRRYFSDGRGDLIQFLQILWSWFHIFSSTVAHRCEGFYVELIKSNLRLRLVCLSIFERSVFSTVLFWCDEHELRWSSDPFWWHCFSLTYACIFSASMTFFELVHCGICWFYCSSLCFSSQMSREKLKSDFSNVFRSKELPCCHWLEVVICWSQYRRRQSSVVWTSPKLR